MKNDFRKRKSIRLKDFDNSLNGSYEDKRVDLVKLYPKVYKQPVKVEKTLLQDIMVYNKTSKDYDYFITRDGNFWIFDVNKELIINNKDDNLFCNCSDKNIDYIDIYCDENSFLSLSHPKYPTKIMDDSRFHIKIIKNPYIDKYNVSFHSDIKDTLPYYGHNIHYFKADYPISI